MPPVVLLTGAGAGGDITLPLDAEPTSVMLAEVGSREDGEAFIVVVPDVAGEGSEVHESRGGLGALQSVLDIPLLVGHGLDLESEGVLLAVELMELSGGVGIGMDVGSKSPVVLLVRIEDEGVGVVRFGVEEFDKPWGKGREVMAVAVTGGGVDGAGVLNVVGSSQGSDDGRGVARAFVDVGGEVGLVLVVVDDEVRDAVVVVDESIRGFILYCPLSVKLLLDLVNCFGIEVGLVEEVGAACLCGVSEPDGNVFGVLE